MALVLTISIIVITFTSPTFAGSRGDIKVDIKPSWPTLKTEFSLYDLGNTEELRKYEGWFPSSESSEINYKTCASVTPGVPLVAVGKSNYTFAAKKILQPVLELICSGKQTTEGFDDPIGFSIWTSRHGYIKEMVTTYPSLRHLVTDTSSRSSSVLLKHFPELLRDPVSNGYLENNPAISVISYARRDYDVYVITNGTDIASKIMIASFKNLPEEYTDNQQDYFNFFEQFGTQFVTRAWLGSRTVFCIVHSSNFSFHQEDGPILAEEHNFSMNDLLKYFSRKVLGKVYRSSVAMEGDEGLLNRPIRLWNDDSNSKPSITKQWTSGLESLFPKMSSRKLKSYVTAKNHYLFHNQLLQWSQFIGIAKGEPNLLEFLKETITSEARQLNPRPQFQQLINTLEDRKMDLGTDYLSCIHEEKLNQTHSSVTEFLYPMVNNICITSSTRFPNCTKIEFHNTTMPRCIVTFTNPRCLKGAEYHSYKDEEISGRLIQQWVRYDSFLPCNKQIKNGITFLI